jgi:hypothetical protein
MDLGMEVLKELLKAHLSALWMVRLLVDATATHLDRLSVSMTDEWKDKATENKKGLKMVEEIVTVVLLGSRLWAMKFGSAKVLGLRKDAEKRTPKE